MYLVIIVREVLTNTLLLGGILAIFSMEFFIVLKTACELKRVLVLAMFEGPDIFLVSLSMSLQT